MTPFIVGLFVPGDRPDRFAKALAAAGNGAVIIDLEDAVAEDRKTAARNAVADALKNGFYGFVRCNDVTNPAGRADLEMLAGRAPAGVMVPKAMPAAVRTVRERLPHSPIVALIESLAGMRDIDGIARLPGVAMLALGGYDLCAEIGARPTAEVLGHWRWRTTFAARGAGIGAIDTPYAALDDAAGLAADARRAVDYGFDGKLAVHPDQVPVIRSAFLPDAAELARARAIVGAGIADGVRRLDGMMIDRPLVEAARRVIARAEATQ